MKIIEVRPAGRFMHHPNKDYDYQIRDKNGWKIWVLVGNALLLHRYALLLHRYELLLHRYELLIFGRCLWRWFKVVRTVPTWEWAQAATSDSYILDEPDYD